MKKFSIVEAMVGCAVIGLIVLVITACVFGTGIFGTYNNLVTKSEDVDTAWSNVETNYQRRFDLIPSLVNATQGFLTQEQKVFGDIADARTRYAGAESGSNEQVEAQGQLESALSRLLVIVENYPELRSNETVQSLMDELAGTENRINIARQDYNEVVRDYNVTVKSFPTNIYARILGFEPKPLYEAEEGAEKAPEVNLNTNIDTNE